MRSCPAIRTPSIAPARPEKIQPPLLALPRNRSAYFSGIRVLVKGRVYGAGQSCQRVRNFVPWVALTKGRARDHQAKQTIGRTSPKLYARRLILAIESLLLVSSISIPHTVSMQGISAIAFLDVSGVAVSVFRGCVPGTCASFLLQTLLLSPDSSHTTRAVAQLIPHPSRWEWPEHHRV